MIFEGVDTAYTLKNHYINTTTVSSKYSCLNISFKQEKHFVFVSAVEQKEEGEDIQEQAE